jgi:hypothetical protein
MGQVMSIVVLVCLFFLHWFSYVDVVMRLQEYTMQVLMPGDDVPRFIAWTAPHRIPPVLDPTEISL